MNKNMRERPDPNCEINENALTAKQWREHYNSNALKYGDSPQANDHFTKGIFNIIKKNIEKDAGNLSDKRILDVGCGTGNFSKGYCHSNRVFGIDFSSEMAHLAARNHLKAIIGSGEQIPFKPETFDVVISIGVLQCMKEPQKILREMYALVVPGGKLMVYTINKQSLVRTAIKIFEGSTKNIIHPHDMAIIEGYLRDLKPSEITFKSLYYPLPFIIKSSPRNIFVRYASVSYYFVIQK